MQEFNLYPQAWAVYIVLGIILLYLVDLKLRHSSFKLRAGILNLLAVGAFTPQTVVDADSLAPLVINCLLTAEIEGPVAIYKGILTLLIIWGILFTATLAIRHFVQATFMISKKPQDMASKKTQQN